MGHLELSKEELEMIAKLLQKASSQSETKWIEEGKNCIDSLNTASNENIISGKEESYRKLLLKIQVFLQTEKN
jgi:hypothetical protein